MCNLYSIAKGPQAIRDFARAMRDSTGNLPPIPGVFPDYFAPVVGNAEDGVCGHCQSNGRSSGFDIARAIPSGH